MSYLNFIVFGLVVAAIVFDIVWMITFHRLSMSVKRVGEILASMQGLNDANREDLTK